MEYLYNNKSLIIFDWMVKDLHLNGSSLIIYAIIYQSCQYEKYFTMPLRYLCEWAGITKQGAIKSLKKLEEIGLIEKEVYYIDNVKHCNYTAIVPEYIRGKTTNE